MADIVKGNKKIINAWATYDLANSVYNLVITATIFPIYYNSVTSEKNAAGNIINNIVPFMGMQIKNTTLYDFAIAFAYLVVSIMVPFLSGVADYGGGKKRFMQLFCYMGAIACTLMFFFGKDTVYLGIILAIIACAGYAGSLVFYNAYLPEIAPPEMHDKVSARGFAMGYIGSSILLILCLVIISNPNCLGWLTSEPTKGFATRFSFVLVGLWWFGFSQITFRNLPKVNKDVNKAKKQEGKYWIKGFKELFKVGYALRRNKRLVRFLIAFFIYSMGVQTVMLVATHFGSDEIKMKGEQLIIVVLIIQFVAMLGSFLFSFVSRKTSNIFTLKVATLVWSAVILCTYLFVYTPKDFYVAAAFVGLVMGGIQSLSRSTYSKMLPETQDNTSYFSFYDVCEKMSIVFGMAIYGVINQLSTNLRSPTVALISFFGLGFLLLFLIPKEEVKK